jgi:nucleoid-associated protein YgaU
MSLRRLALTSAFMSLVAVGLAALTPAAADMTRALGSPQHTADITGADSLVIAASGLLAWAVWAWGVLGLALTAASALPGIAGSAARLATHVLLPAGARRSAGVLLGLGLGVVAPLAGAATTVLAAPALAAVPAAAVPDWPATAPAGSPAQAPASTPVSAPVPEWPDASPVISEEGAHVVVRGDCLWHIAGSRLLASSGSQPTDGDIARAVHDWWTANVDVIGPDPDHLLPGQVLRPPGPA